MICSFVITLCSSGILYLLLFGHAGNHHNNQQTLCASFAPVWWTHLFHTASLLLSGSTQVLTAIWATGIPLTAMLLHWIRSRISARGVYFAMWQRFLNAKRGPQGHVGGTACHRQMQTAQKLRSVNLSRELIGMNNTGLSILFQVFGTARVQTVTGIDAQAGAGALFLRLDNNALRPQHMQLILAAVSTNPMLAIGAISFDFNKYLLRPPSQLLHLEKQLEGGEEQLSKHCLSIRACSCQRDHFSSRVNQQHGDVSSSTSQPSPRQASIKDPHKGSSSSLVPHILLHSTHAAGPNTGTMASLERRLWGLGSFLIQYEPLVSLSLKGVEMPAPVFDALCDALRLSSIKVLDVSGCSLTATHASSLGGLLEDSTTLRKLSMACNPKLGAGGGTVIARGIQSITCRAQLDFLDASWCRLRLEGVEALLQAIDQEASSIRAAPPSLDVHSNSLKFGEYKLLFDTFPGNLESYGCLADWEKDTAEPLELNRIQHQDLADRVVKDLCQHMILGPLLANEQTSKVHSGLAALVSCAIGGTQPQPVKLIRKLLPTASTSINFFDQVLLSTISALQYSHEISMPQLRGVVRRFHSVQDLVLGNPVNVPTGSSLSAMFTFSPRCTGASMPSETVHDPQSAPHADRSILVRSRTHSTSNSATYAGQATANGLSQVSRDASEAEESTAAEVNEPQKGMRKIHSAHTMLRLLSSRTAVGDWLADRENQSVGSTPRSQEHADEKYEATEGTACSESDLETWLQRSGGGVEQPPFASAKFASSGLGAQRRSRADAPPSSLAQREESIPVPILSDDRQVDRLRVQRSGEAQ